MGKAVIVVENLTVAGNGRDRLAGVSLEIGEGETVGVIGPNGAGKSTLLNVLAGVERQWSGSVHVFGRSLGDWDRQAYARAVAYLPQEFRSQWALTVEDLVAIGASRGRGFGWVQDGGGNYEWIFEAFDLSGLRRRVFNTLSGGEKARVALAASVASEPRVLLADEPVASLDPLHQLEAMERLRALTAAGTTVVIVLHDLTMVARFCDRLILLDAGRIACAGTPDTVLRPNWLAKVYGIEALMGEHEGARYVVPWSRAASARGAERME